MIVLSRFYLSMLPDSCSVEVERISKEKALELLMNSPFNQSAVENGMVEVFSRELGVNVPPSNRRFFIKEGDELLVGQHRRNDENGEIVWYSVKVK